jgi:hypothetical protein
MRHSFEASSSSCSTCGVARDEVDLVPRCESMPYVGGQWWAPSSPDTLGRPVLELAAELVDLSGPEGARFARALEVR